jgi:16S rRNA U516 pseudouridylate synthase RsuA-like enzyme
MQFGKSVLALHRSKIENIDLKSLKIGEWRYLSRKEVSYLKDGKKVL